MRELKKTGNRRETSYETKEKERKRKRERKREREKEIRREE